MQNFRTVDRMPTPIGHALGGMIVGYLMTPSPTPDATRVPGNPRAPLPRTPYSTPITLCVVAACLPDIDFFWGRHNMETHSIGFAVLVGLAVFAWQRSARLAVACAVAVGTHVLFDWLGSDDSPPLGVMALWPLTNHFYFAEAFIFEAVSRRYWLPGFVPHNALAVMREIAILAPVVVALWWRRRH